MTGEIVSFNMWQDESYKVSYACKIWRFYLLCVRFVLKDAWSIGLVDFDLLSIVIVDRSQDIVNKCDVHAAYENSTCYVAREVPVKLSCITLINFSIIWLIGHKVYLGRWHMHEKYGV